MRFFMVLPVRGAIKNYFLILFSHRLNYKSVTSTILFLTSLTGISTLFSQLLIMYKDSAEIVRIDLSSSILNECQLKN